MNKEQQYLENSGKGCPNCGYSLVVGDLPVLTMANIEIARRCYCCGASWVDLYQLTSVADAKGFNPKDPA